MLLKTRARPFPRRLEIAAASILSPLSFVLKHRRQRRTMSRSDGRFSSQRRVRRPWRRYVDQLTIHRPTLHAYCCRLAGNVWDGEDLVPDTLARVFSQLGKSDVRL